MNGGEWRRYAAELLGTFVLVFGGCTSVVGANMVDAPVDLVAAFGFGLALLAGLYAFGEVSGGHFNPAVSLGMFLDRRLNGRDLVFHWAFQLVGAVLGALVLLVATTQGAVASAANKPASGVSDGAAFVIELTMTAIFVVVILQASRSDRFGSSALVAIPLTLVAAHLVAIPFTGCSVNPARSFGPALVGNEWTGFWIFVVAPLLGAAVAFAVHRLVVTPSVAPEAAVAEVLDSGAAS